jgi:nucleotide-binding universal stress UspA family protein
MAIIAAVDRSEKSSRVVDESARLAAAFDDTVHVVHALTRSEFLDLGITGAQTENSKDMEQIRSAAAEMAEQSVSGLDVPYETIGLVGEPADAVVEYAKEQNAKYIVVGPRKRSRTGKALFGSKAQSILLNATCPVVSTINQGPA